MDATTLTKAYDLPQFGSMQSPHNEPTPICCCSFLDERLGPDQHLADCELRLLAVGSDSNSSVGSPSEASEAAVKRRKHRESMARLRQKLRDSIGRLQQQEQQLVHDLRRSVNQYQPQQVPAADTRLKLRQAYFELVKEQLALQDERQTLDDTWSQKAAYERIVDRELDRMKEAALTTLHPIQRTNE